MEKPIHFRRCHMCGTVNVRESTRVERCRDCGRSLAPFYYYDERFMAVASDKTLRPPLAENEYSPIQGLTVYWESY